MTGWDARRVGAQMRRCRVAGGYSRRTLAFEARISMETVKHAELGRGDIRLETLWRCADVLGVGLDEYVGRRTN